MGLEVYGATALLRSAVVAGDHQRSGVGTALFVRLLDLARDEKVARLILLTNTAESYFRRKGFRTVDANAITGPIRQSTEFTGACPSTAVCMELTL
jgi:N-acetylglutamate synthase-like GNAT family acetyltransferase